MADVPEKKDPAPGSADFSQLPERLKAQILFRRKQEEERKKKELRARKRLAVFAGAAGALGTAIAAMAADEPALPLYMLMGLLGGASAAAIIWYRPRPLAAPFLFFVPAAAGVGVGRLLMWVPYVSTNVAQMLAVCFVLGAALGVWLKLLDRKKPAAAGDASAPPAEQMQ